MKKLLLTTALVLAMSGAAYAQPDEHGGPPDGPPPMHCDKAFEGLPQDKAEMFRATMEQGHEKGRALHDKMHAIHEALHDIITAPEFDKAKFIAKSKEMGDLQEKMHADMTEAMASAFGQLSPAERGQVADGLRECHEGMHGSGPGMGMKHGMHPHKPVEGDNPEPSDSGH